MIPLQWHQVIWIRRVMLPLYANMILRETLAGRLPRKPLNFDQPWVTSRSHTDFGRDPLALLDVKRKT